MKKRLLSLLTIFAVAMTFVFTYSMTDGNAYAASKTKKYYLPKEIHVVYFDDDSTSSLTEIKYDKYGNMKSAWISEAIPSKYTIKYRNKKGAISTVKYGDGDAVSKKYYDKKGRLTKVKVGSDIYKYTLDKKGTIKKVTLNGKTYYKVKSVKYHKNGFVSKVVYGNGNVNTYNSSGLLTSATEKGGSKYTYKYTKKNGKIVKMVVKRDGENFKKITLKYGKSTTTDVWKYSSIICYANGPSNACELYAKGALSGVNEVDY